MYIYVYMIIFFLFFWINNTTSCCQLFFYHITLIKKIIYIKAQHPVDLLVMQIYAASCLWTMNVSFCLFCIANYLGLNRITKFFSTRARDCDLGLEFHSNRNRVHAFFSLFFFISSFHLVKLECGGVLISTLSVECVQSKVAPHTES